MNDTTRPMILMITGDGGWTGWDQSLAAAFARIGCPVAALDAQRYFWDPKDPQTVTLAVERMAEYYSALWQRKEFLLVGYSFGADIVPFVANRLSPGSRKFLRGVAMLSPDPRADFEIHIADMLDVGDGSGTYDVLSEVARIRTLPVICLFGQEESDSDPEAFRLPGIRVEIVPGSHHYGDDFTGVAGTVLTLRRP